MSNQTPPNKISKDAFHRTQPMVTVEDIKTRYLFGIDLTDENGNPMPREVLQHALLSAISYVEMKLDIIILPTEFQENYDYRAQDYTNFNFISLKKRPVCEVLELKAKFPNNVDLVDYPKEWFVLEKEAGQIQLSPVEGTFSGLIVTQGGSYVPLIYGSRDYWPHLFQVRYKAGFENDCIPVVINEIIGMHAAVKIFDIMGDITIGPGIQSESVNIDGAGTSKSLSSSAMYSTYASRIESYRKQVNEYIDVVRKYYNGFSFVVA